MTTKTTFLGEEVSMSQQTNNSRVSNVQVSEDRCGSSPLQESCVNISSRNLGDRLNVPVTPIGRTDGVVVKIPVVLAELNVRFFVNAMIDLPEPALEIKDIKKNLKITQCMLLQPTNVLFIKGFVRKNIDYSTMNCSNTEGVCGEIHHCTIDVPFEATTPVEFFREPEPVFTNNRNEFGYLKEESLPLDSFAEKDKLMSSDFSEFNQVSSEYFNELPYCDLISSNITVFDEYINRRRPVDIDLPFEERLFTQVEEKMVVELRLKVLQRQQVNVPSTSGGSICRGQYR